MLPSQINSTQNNNAIKRLTALWALSESGLGGMMFALKIPFTGFFVGGFAIIMLGLIAFFSNNNYKQIIKSTIIVLMVKAVVSPHSPLPAYLAVAFQGISAAIFFSLFSYKTACIILGIVSMAESAIQKIITLTILFGKKLWEAIDALFVQITNEFSIAWHKDYSLWLIGIYILFFIIWGAIVGRWASKIPQYISEKKDDVLHDYENVKQQTIAVNPIRASKRKTKRIIYFTAILIFIVGVFLISGSSRNTVLFILGRSIAVLLIIYFIFTPLTKWLLQKWLHNRPSNQKKAAEEVITLLPQMRTYVGSAFTMAINELKYFKRLRKFILYIIILSLYAEQPQ